MAWHVSRHSGPWGRLSRDGDCCTALLSLGQILLPLLWEERQIPWVENGMFMQKRRIRKVIIVLKERDTSVVRSFDFNPDF